MRICTTAFIFFKDKLLIVYHKKLNRWVHVGGHLEEGEFLDEALLREIREEVGLEVEILDSGFKLPDTPDSNIYYQKIPFFVHGSMIGGKKGFIGFDYVCVAKNDNVTLQLSELSEYKWVTKKELEQLEVSPFYRALTLKAFEFYESKLKKKN